MHDGKADRLGKSLKLLVKTSIIVFIGVMISRILGYLYRVIVARYYGPEVYGLFSLALMVSGWFIAVSALGLAEGLLRFISLYRGKKELEKIKWLFKFSLIILTITGVLAGILLFVFSEYISITIFHNASLIAYLKIFSIAIPFTVLAYPFLVALRAHEEISSYSFIFNIAQNAVKVAFLGLFIVLGFGNNAVPWSYLAGMFGMMTISYLVCKYKIPHIFELGTLPQHKKGILLKELMSYSVPILFFGIVSTIFYWIDSFSIGYYKSAIEVGFYNAAVPIALLLGIAPELFMQLFFPLITKEYSRKNIKLIEELSKQVAKWILLVNIPVFALMLAFPGAVINILFGQEYLVAENALRILAISSLLSSVLIVSNQLISMIGRAKLVLTNIIIASAINLMLNMLFVPMQKIWFIENSLGINGAALATLISILVFNLLFVIESYYYLRIIPVRRKMINLLVSAVIPTALLFYLRTIISSNNILVLALLGAGFVVVYAALVLATKSMDENDWKIMKSAWNKVISYFSQGKSS